MGDEKVTLGQADIDLDAYCRRIGYAGVRESTLDVLRAIHELHPRAIAFENLDPVLRRPVRLDARSLQEKMLQGGRGGYCFEQNMLLSLALRAIGFKVTDLSGRVRYGVPEGVATPRTHMLLLIDLDGERMIVDVGFGANTMTGPLLLDSRSEQATPHESFRIVEARGRYLVEVKIRDVWTPLYSFDLEPQHLPDLELGNRFMSTNPKSRFYSDLSVTRVEPGRRYALNGNQLAVHRLDGATERRVLVDRI